MRNIGAALFDKMGAIYFVLGLTLFLGTEGYKVIFLTETSFQTGTGLLHHMGLFLFVVGAVIMFFENIVGTREEHFLAVDDDDGDD